MGSPGSLSCVTDSAPAITNPHRAGWSSSLSEFATTATHQIASRIREFVIDASPEQIRAWRESIPALQNQSRYLLVKSRSAAHFGTILEYELPLESRRIDVVVLTSGAVVVVEVKARGEVRQVDLDQVLAYGRDLRCYHRACDAASGGRVVHMVLLLMRARGYLGQQQGVHIVGPDHLGSLLEQLDRGSTPVSLTLEDFLASDSYRPLPTLIQAARELFHSGSIRTIHRARAFTTPALECVTEIIRDAARTGTRRLILLTGVPGAGKTLVGLQVVHAHFLDSLAVPRQGAQPSSPAVFLSGNGPLVEVLQYELRAAGGDGKAFVRGVKDYVKAYSGRNARVPPEHVLVFDEAQRAWDQDRMAEKHGQPDLSEPDQLVAFAERVPGWSVIVGLVGGGQEIHIGEEAGLTQWSRAIERSPSKDAWTVHGPPGVALHLSQSSHRPFVTDSRLSLDREIRFHFAQQLHRFVGELLDGRSPTELQNLAEALEDQGYHFRITRDLDLAKQYLKDRYSAAPLARYGLLASSKDKSLVGFGVPNDFQSTKRVKIGPWYSDPESDPSQLSCRHLTTCVTEFSAQGLELDAALVAWGTDLVRESGAWSIRRARGYLRGAKVRDPRQLRVNSYRVLLSRGRDATVIFVPPLPELDETDQYLRATGIRPLDQ